MAISRVKAADAAHRKGVLFTNPGGPGGSGIRLSWLIGSSQPKVAAEYDIIGMDPRGVGESTQLICDVPVDQLDSAVHDSRDLSAQAVTARQRTAKAVADGCAANPLTRYVNTWQTTHDMDMIRAVLGERKLNYLGYSYGSWLGAKYAALFPRRTGRIVLDSNTAWMDDLADSWERMPMAFQRRWERQFAPWATRSAFFSKYLGRTPAQVNAVYEQVRETFIKATDNLSAGQVLDGFVRTSLYTDAGFITIGASLGVLKSCLVDNHDWSRDALLSCGQRFSDELSGSGVAGTEFQAEARVGTDALLHPEKLGDAAPEGLSAVFDAVRNATGDTVQVSGVYYAVRCGDGGQWHSPNWWVNFARRNGPAYPLTGYETSQEVCSYWTLSAQRLPNPDEHRLAPIVTVQSEFDPATAYENTSRNVRQFHDARLVAIDDAGAHGQYGIRGNGCVDDIVNAYLLDGVTPPARSVCKGLPLPLENTVHAVPGPVDSSTRPHASRAEHVPARLRHAAEKIIK
ncbi:alpha/beta hydrolase [Wenjunlia tyrosinilytica]|uniref:alpha/beta hydrolase n=1 Tax=Wenjunlia tyrosinilytica TaxID=1544741 RepID=UPI001668F3DE|nr:alpha/beta hydrolase [Wenjunlia tyrosinilytica]